MPGTTPILHDEDPHHVWMEGRFGFPSVAIKKCAVAAANLCGLQKTAVRQVFHVEGDLVEIHSDSPVMRRDWVRPQFNTTDLAYRPEFKNWTMDVLIKYNADVITAAQLVNLLVRGGFGVGIGAFRPEKDGQWGMFTVTELEDMPD